MSSENVPEPARREPPGWLMAVLPTWIKTTLTREQIGQLYNLGVNFLSGVVIPQVPSALSGALATVIRILLDRQKSGGVIELQQHNPYFSPTGSGIVKDG